MADSPESDEVNGGVESSGAEVGKGEGRVVIEGLLGRGGMGAVYLGTQPSLNRPVAVKILPKEVSDDQSAVERFRREAQSMAQLQHPGIVEVYDFGRSSDEGLLYYVMELVKGEPLDQRLQRCGKLEIAEAVEITAQAAEAVHFAHQWGVVHRDLKPANILVTSEGVAKVADFGLARIAGVSDAMALTLSGTALGTTGYMAPEQLEGRSVDQRADVYSLGVILYQLLTGMIPRGAFEDASAVNPDVSIGFDDVIQRAMVYEQEHRFQTAAEFVLCLRELQVSLTSAKPALPRPASPHGVSRGPKLVRSAERPSGSQKIAMVVWSLVIVLVFTTIAVFLAFDADSDSESLPGNAVAAFVSSERPSLQETVNEQVSEPVSESVTKAVVAVSSVEKSLPVEQNPPPPAVGSPEPKREPEQNFPRAGEARFPLKPPPVMKGRLVIIPSEEGLETKYSAAERLPDNLGPVRQIAIGAMDVDRNAAKPIVGSWGVALMEDGTLRAWGRKNSYCTKPPTSISDVVQVAASPFLGAALKSDGSVVRWGGHKRFVKIPPYLPRMTRIELGWSTLVGITEHGTVEIVGPDGHVHTSTPVPPEAVDVVDIAVGTGHIMALRSDGKVIVWGMTGRDTRGRIYGYADSLESVVAIATGDGGNGAVTADGELHVWSATSSSIFQERFHDVQDIIMNGATAVKTSAGWNVLWSSKTVQVFDRYSGLSGFMVDHGFAYGFAEDPSAVTFEQPSEMSVDDADLPDLPPLPEVSFPLAARGHPGQLIVELEDSANSGRTGLSVPDDTGLVRQVAKSDGHIVAVMADGTVGAWARENASGRATVPAGLRDVAEVAAGDAFSVALKRDGTVVAWGDPLRCRLPPLSGVVRIVADGDRSAALTADGRVITWGRPSAEAAEPGQPPSLRSVVAIDNFGSSFIALRSDGKIVQWGNKGSTGLKQQSGERYTAITSAIDESFCYFALTEKGQLDRFSIFDDAPSERLFESPDLRRINGGTWVAGWIDHRWNDIWHKRNKAASSAFERVAHCPQIITHGSCHVGIQPTANTGYEPVDAVLGEFAKAYQTRYSNQVREQRDQALVDYRADLLRRRDEAQRFGKLELVLTLQKHLKLLENWTCPWPVSRPEAFAEPFLSAAIYCQQHYRESLDVRLREIKGPCNEFAKRLSVAIDGLAPEVSSAERQMLKSRIVWHDIFLALDHEIITPTGEAIPR